MKPLLRIQTIPIRIEAQSRRASLQLSEASEAPKADVSRRRGKANTRTPSPRISSDTAETRVGAGFNNSLRTVREPAQTGGAAALDSTRNYSGETGQVGETSGMRNPIVNTVASSLNGSVHDAPVQSSRQDSGLNAEQGSFSFDYQMDSLTFDWNVRAKPQLEFVPASIEYSIKQYPEVIIEYVGEPVYFPVSANPNHQK